MPHRRLGGRPRRGLGPRQFAAEVRGHPVLKRIPHRKVAPKVKIGDLQQSKGGSENARRRHAGRAARTAFGVCRTTVSISVSATKSETRLNQATSEVSAGKAAKRASIRLQSAEKSCAGVSSSGSPLLISHGRVFGTGPRRDRLVCCRCGLPSQSALMVSANGKSRGKGRRKRTQRLYFRKPAQIGEQQPENEGIRTASAPGCAAAAAGALEPTQSQARARRAG